jgi:hypothetical protein
MNSCNTVVFPILYYPNSQPSTPIQRQLPRLGVFFQEVSLYLESHICYSYLHDIWKFTTITRFWHTVLYLNFLWLEECYLLGCDTVQSDWSLPMSSGNSCLQFQSQRLSPASKQRVVITLRVACSAYSTIMKMETVFASEMFVNYTYMNITILRCENPKSHIYKCCVRWY